MYSYRLFRELPGRALLVLIGLAVAGGCYATAAVTANVAASAGHGFSLNTSGTACAAGENGNGELGDGTTVPYESTPTQVLNLVGTMTSISTGTYHTVALKNDGTVWTWGYNQYGQLGVGNTFVERPTPFSVPGLTNIVAVAAGRYHTLALKSDGTLWGWGYNAYGEVGDGTTTERTTPVQAINVPSGVVAIAAGQYFSLALTSSGALYAWGYNGYGQLGDGTTTNRSSPVPVTTLQTNVTQIAAGQYHALALKSDGSIWGMGLSNYGQLGYGGTSSASTPVRVSFPNGTPGAISIAAGDYHSLASLSDGSVWAWGYNGDGELGDTTTTSENTPVKTGVPVSAFTSLTAVAAGARFSLALQSNGTIWAWGDNTLGQFGDGNTTQSYQPLKQSACVVTTLVPPGVSSFITRIAANLKTTLLAKGDGTVWGFGDNTYGQLGNGTQTDPTGPVQASGVTGAIDVSTGGYHSIAVTSGGSVWTWGYNGYGELGSGNTTNRPTPLAINNFAGAVAVAAGQYHSLALKSDGTVWGFGYNGYGQLGDGSTTQRNVPIEAIGLNGVTAVAAGQYHSVALKNDGTVWAWGYNGYGQVGNGTNVQQTSAVQVLGLANIVAIAAGQNYSLALRNDGTVWSWGYNAYGDLGDGDTATEYSIVRVSGLSGVVAIAAGVYHSLAVKNDGSVWAWGYNGDGELGNGSSTNSYTPVQVHGQSGFLTGALAVAAGTNYSVALRTDGTLYFWGANDVGQFGVTTATTASSTVAIQGAVAPGSVPQWIVAYVLNTAVSPPGGGTIVTNPNAAANYYAAGTAVCLTAFPAAGEIFTGWSGTALNAANCLTMTGSAAVAANFTANPLTAASALRFIPATPCRLVDTRNTAGPLGGPSIAAGGTRSFTIPGACNIPSTALAYSLNLTVVPQGTLGYVSMWPTGQSQPVVSTLNSPDGRIKSNAAIVPAGTGGAVSVFATDSTNVILDINGYFDSYTDPSALQFYPLTPCRVADTRNGSGALGGPSLLANQSRIFPVMSSVCGIPGNALAYSLNFTAIPQVPLGYLTVWPNGQSQPVVSTLNAPTGAVTANAAIVPAGTAGAIELFVTNAADMAIDINGYFAAPATGGLSLYNLTPCRIEDTRQPAGTPAFIGTVTETATGVVCGVPPEARSVVLNATVVPSGSLTYISLWANGGAQPVVSTLNAIDGSVTSNMAVVPTTNGLVNAYASGPGGTYLILDISGYFAP